MLSGLLQPTAGDCVVWGHRVASHGGMAAIRRITGVCPQQNVLFPVLTGRLLVFSFVVVVVVVVYIV
jgi:ATP-binding cassette subfamily A (ABC1) protein 5